MDGELLLPRQQLTSVPFAMNAGALGGTQSGDYYTKAEVDALLAAMQAQIDGNSVNIAANAGDISLNQADITANATAIDGATADIAANAIDIATNAANISGATADIAALDTRVSGNEQKLDPVSVAMSGSTVTDFIFTSVNVHVRSGTGATDGDTNGLGNLIVGYNELRGSGDNRSGSHNLVVGAGHSYSSYGGFLAGLDNEISGPYSSVSGGGYNTASGDRSSVSGGSYNTANNTCSSVSGGRDNTASGIYSSVSGGEANSASGHSSSVMGGRYNEASGEFSSVAGGGDYNPSLGNIAFANYSAILVLCQLYFVGSYSLCASDFSRD